MENKVFNIRVDTVQNKAVDIVPRLIELVGELGVKNGLCYVQCFTDSCGVYVSDKYMAQCGDLAEQLTGLVPSVNCFNAGKKAPSHVSASIKSILVNRSAVLNISDGALSLPRNSSVFITNFEGSNVASLLVSFYY